MTIQFRYNMRLSIPFLLGLSLFFVAHEPAPFDILASLLFLKNAAYIMFYALHPVFFVFLFAQVLAASIELLYFGSAFWSIISVYLFALMILFINLSLKPDQEQSFISGGVFGALFTLAFYFSDQSVVIFDGIRMQGFFKDPNVLGVTALGLFFLAYPKSKMMAAVFLLCLMLSLSRASLIAFFIGLTFVGFYGINFKIKILFAAAFFLVLPFLPDLLNLIFSLIGRGGLVNPYDFDRLDNWLSLIKTWSNSSFPLGPGFSEANGYAVHSTYLRLLVEQGVFSLFAFFLMLFCAFWCARKDVWALGALVALLANGLVIDGTHWRILFIVLGICIARGIKSEPIFVKFENGLRSNFSRNLVVKEKSAMSDLE